MVSSGLDDIDKILGGGYPLGSIVLVEEDGWTSHHMHLMKYFVSEGLLSGHSICFISPKDGQYSFGDFVMKEISSKEAEKDIAAEKAAAEEAKKETKLRIAWQYEKFMKRAATVESSKPGPTLGGMGASMRGPQPMIRSRSPWCHNYDIKKLEDPEKLQEYMSSQVHWKSIESGPNQTGEDDNRMKETIEKIASFQSWMNSNSPRGSEEPARIARLVVPSLGSVAWHNSPDTHLKDSGLSLIVRTMVQLKKAAQETKICIMVTLPTYQYSSSGIQRCEHIADIVLRLESVEDSSQVVQLAADSRTVAGVLRLKKLNIFGAAGSPAPQIVSYLIRNRRRSISIKPVEIDPDAEANHETHEQTTSGGVIRRDNADHIQPSSGHQLDF